MWPFSRKAEISTTTAALPKARAPMISLKRMFDGARTDRFTTGWTTSPTAAHEIINRNQVKLVARSRELAANNDHAKKFIGLCVTNIIGNKGIVMQAQAKAQDGKLDKAANEAIEATWRTWCRGEHCDIKGRRNLKAMMQSLIRTAAKDGEIFIHIVENDTFTDFGITLQTIDPQRCPVDLNEELSGGRYIQHGIEFDKNGRRLAYYFQTKRGTIYRNGKQYQRLDAKNIIHEFIEEFEGQERGLPWMASALLRLKMLNEYEKAALINARTTASKSGYLVNEDGEEDSDPYDEPEVYEMEAGQYHVLNGKWSVHDVNPNYPAGEFTMFQKAMLRGVATGFGVAYNNLANDLEGVNFSSIRSGTLDEREWWKVNQEWFVDGVMIKIYERWLDQALLRGKIKTVTDRPYSVSEYERFANVEWQARRWAWIDPRAEVAAAAASLAIGSTSLSQIIRDQGRDPETVFQEIARDRQALLDAGIKPAIVDKFTMGEKLIGIVAGLNSQNEGEQNE